MSSDVVPNSHAIHSLFPFPAIRCRRIVRDSEKRVGDLRLDGETAYQLGTNNIGVLVACSHQTAMLIEKFRELSRSEAQGQFVIALSTNKLADEYFRDTTDYDHSVPRKDSWSFGCITFTTPEKLHSIGPNQVGDRPVIGVGLVDTQCILHLARGYAWSGYPTNDRPQHIVKFRAANEIDGWRPPFFLFTERPAKSLNTTQMLGPYSLDAWWFVDGSEIRMGALPQPTPDVAPPVKLEFTEPTFEPVMFPMAEVGGIESIDHVENVNADDSSYNPYEFSNSSVPISADDIPGESFDLDSDIDLGAEDESEKDLTDGHEVESNDVREIPLDVETEVTPTIADSSPFRNEKLIEFEELVASKSKQLDLLLEESRAQLQQIRDAHQSIEDCCRRAELALKLAEEHRDHSHDLRNRMESFFAESQEFKNATESLYRDTQRLNQEARLNHESAELLHRSFRKQLNMQSVEVKSTAMPPRVNSDSLNQPFRNVELTIASNSIGMKLVKVPAGCFEMGSSTTDIELINRNFRMFPTKDQIDECPTNRVQISKPFFIGAHEVTLGQFLRFYVESKYKLDSETKGAWGYDPDRTDTPFCQMASARPWSWGFEGQTMDHPVVNVSWNDAKAFCRWLSEKEGKTYRLPSEAEWEYACRAGTSTVHPAGDDLESLANIANVSDLSASRIVGAENWAVAPFDDGYSFTAPVGMFAPNAFGLFDMIGNAAEWCDDVYDSAIYEKRLKTVADPKVETGSEFRCIRGGSWLSDPSRARSSFRFRLAASKRTFSVGFRVVLEDTLPN